MRLPHLFTLTLAIGCLTATTAAAAPATMRIEVRVYDQAGIDHAVDAALATARDTLAAVWIEPEWIRCGLTSAENALACRAAVHTGELSLRFARTEVVADPAGRLPLGDSLIDRDLGVGVLATIYYDRVLWMAHAANADPSPLLGHAVAHEIAHLLMGSQRHDARGLMRALWTREDVARNRPSDWMFTAADAAAIRRRASLAAAPRQARSLPRSPSSSSGAAGSGAESSGTLPLQ